MAEANGASTRGWRRGSWGVFAVLGAGLVGVACSSSVEGETSKPKGGDGGGADDSATVPADARVTDSGTRPGKDASTDAPSTDAPSSDGGVAVRGQNCAGYIKASPAKGAHEYFVDGAKGSDSNDGSSSQPFQTAGKAAEVGGAGDVVTIRAGSYTGLVTVPNSGAMGAPLVFQADVCGEAIFTGQTGFYPAVGASETLANGCTTNGPGQHDITISGLTFKDTHDSPSSGGYSTVLFLNDRWSVTNVLIDGADDIEINERGYGDVIEQSTFMHGGSHSLVGCGGNTIVRNVINANNVTSATAAANCGDSCSVKFLFTDGMLVDNIESYGNNGPGWWFDTDNKNFTVRNSSFHDNAATWAGIADEISDGPGLIENNTFANNGADIGIWESKAVTIRNNTMTGGSGSPFQFRTLTNRCEVMSGSTCSTWYQVGNLDVHDNKAKDWTQCLIDNPSYSSDPMWASPLFTTLNIAMDSDDLSASATANCFLSWQNEPSIGSFAQLQTTLGVEEHGTDAPF
jgi:hypothetical protein